VSFVPIESLDDAEATGRTPAQESVSQEQLEKFGQLLRWLREARGWSLRDAGERCGVSYQTIRNMEEGVEIDGRRRFNVPSIWVLMRLSEGYGVALPIITKAAYGIALDVVGAPDVLPQVYQKIHEAAEILAQHIAGGQWQPPTLRRHRGRPKRSEKQNEMKLPYLRPFIQPSQVGQRPSDIFSALPS